APGAENKVPPLSQDQHMPAFEHSWIPPAVSFLIVAGRVLTAVGKLLANGLAELAFVTASAPPSTPTNSSSPSIMVPVDDAVRTIPTPFDLFTSITLAPTRVLVAVPILMLIAALVCALILLPRISHASMG